MDDGDYSTWEIVYSMLATGVAIVFYLVLLYFMFLAFRHFATIVFDYILAWRMRTVMARSTTGQCRECGKLMATHTRKQVLACAAKHARRGLLYGE